MDEMDRMKAWRRWETNEGKQHQVVIYDEMSPLSQLDAPRYHSSCNDEDAQGVQSPGLYQETCGEVHAEVVMWIACRMRVRSDDEQAAARLLDELDRLSIEVLQ